MFSIPKFATAVAISCLSLAVIPVRSAVIDVTVGGTGVIAYTPNQVQANVGDVIQFTFKQKNHTITRSTLATPCSPLVGEGAFDSGFVFVADNETDFPLAQLTVQDTNPIWIYCRQTGHCGMGMVFAVNPGDKFAAFQAAATGSAPVSSAAASVTAAPSGVVTVTATVTVSGEPITTTYGSYPGSAAPTTPVSTDHVIVVGGTAGNVYTPSNITAQPGDTVTFQFHAKNHTVTASSFADPCRALSLTSTTGELGFDSGFMSVSPNATDFPTFTIQINDTKPIWGYCRQTGHCGGGMVFSVNAIESGPNNFAAFQAKAIQLNGTTAPGSSPSGSNSADTTNGALLPVRSAAAMVALVGVVVGMVL
ncbi:Programmed cell death protein 5 [Mycena venus]|uniref:Programmed cell death protein 5 n=1 Tax=Mycena venus TaxID=2733690 RepID=A0A8H7CX77_9AGAR|nr:Programmed cell death protein 5 [Mycena venus]